MSEAVIDNDVLIKTSAYGLLAETSEAFGKSVGVLGVARFVVSKHIERHRRIADPDSALSTWADFLERAEELEPTEDELSLATVIETAASKHGVQLDTGESQICAIAIHRGVPWVITGDKRATIGAETLLAHVAELGALAGVWVCLEQLIGALAMRIGLEQVRDRVCAEPDVDRSLKLCMSCGATFHQAEEGLNSYVRDLRRQAQTVLASDADLRAVMSRTGVIGE